jgi:hypothetical protein
VKEQELRQDVPIGVEGIDVIGGKLQKGFVVGGKEGPGTGGQGLRESGHIEVVAKDGEIGFIANDSVCRKQKQIQIQILRREKIVLVSRTKHCIFYCWLFTATFALTDGLARNGVPRLRNRRSNRWSRCWGGHSSGC